MKISTYWAAIIIDWTGMLQANMTKLRHFWCLREIGKQTYEGQKITLQLQTYKVKVFL